MLLALHMASPEHNPDIRALTQGRHRPGAGTTRVLGCQGGVSVDGNGGLKGYKRLEVVEGSLISTS